MKQSPILFSTPMVQSVLNNTKTNTRRLNGLEEINKEPNSYFADDCGMNKFYDGKKHQSYFWVTFKRHPQAIAYKIIKCPYGSIGDVLWVRETAMCVGFDKDGEYPEGKWIYKADSPDISIYEVPHWKPSIFMPKSAARIWLKITSIGAERLHSISEEDILAEGVRVLVNGTNPIFYLGNDNGAIQFMPPTFLKDKVASNYQFLFAHWAELWCKINGRANWDLNPWVWIIKFERIEKPV